jgi:hypothetical protein
MLGSGADELILFFNQLKMPHWSQDRASVPHLIYGKSTPRPVVLGRDRATPDASARPTNMFFLSSSSSLRLCPSPMKSRRGESEGGVDGGGAEVLPPRRAADYRRRWRRPQESS